VRDGNLKVVIVGSGPAGLFAAYELSSKFDVNVFDMASTPGGSGLRSDGKLNFHPRIGGDLTEFLDEEEAWNLLKYIENIFIELGAPEPNFREDMLRRLELKAVKAGIKFIPIRQSHIGSDELPKFLNRMVDLLKDKGVKFYMNHRVSDIIVEGNTVKYVVVKGKKVSTDFLLLAPGRIGSEWLEKTLRSIGVRLNFNPIDIGVRVEVPTEIFYEIVYEYGAWDPKFHVRTSSYDDFVRTFCTNPDGYVVIEPYGNSIFGVNGHSFRKRKSGLTNFALLVRVSLTQPLENTMLYGKRIAQLINTLGGGKPIIQRLGDLLRSRRSTWSRINKSYIEPTLKNVTPGDIAMAYPHRILQDILEGLEKLDKVVQGVYNDNTLLYAPEIKFYAMRVKTNNQLQTKIRNLFVAGDGAGVSRGIIGAAATGIIASRGIIREANK